jgi:hypothetical protein
VIGTTDVPAAGASVSHRPVRRRGVGAELAATEVRMPRRFPTRSTSRHPSTRVAASPGRRTVLIPPRWAGECARGSQSAPVQPFARSGKRRSKSYASPENPMRCQPGCRGMLACAWLVVRRAPHTLQRISQVNRTSVLGQAWPRRKLRSLSNREHPLQVSGDIIYTSPSGRKPP